MKKIFVCFLGAMSLLSAPGCDSYEFECKDGTRLCEGNLSRTCVSGVWREVLCERNAPICDAKYGCMKATGVNCGNGAIDAGEQCDGNAPHGKTCSDFNASLRGIPECHDCMLDYQNCSVVECQESQKQCHNGVLQFCSEQRWLDIQDCTQSGLVCDTNAPACVKE